MNTLLLAAVALSESTFVRLAPMNTEPVIDGVITPAEERASSVQYGATSDETGLMTKRYALFQIGYTEKGIYFAARTSVPEKPAVLTADDRVSIELLPPGAEKPFVFSHTVTNNLVGVTDFGVPVAESEMFIPYAKLGLSAAPKDGEKWGVNMHVDFSNAKEHGRWHYAKGNPEELATVVIDRKAPTPSLVGFGKLEAWRQTMNYRINWRFNNANGPKAAFKPDVVIYRGIAEAKLDSNAETGREIVKEPHNAGFYNMPLAAGECQDVIEKVWIIIPGTTSKMVMDIGVGDMRVYRRTLLWDLNKGLDWNRPELPFIRSAFYPCKDNFLRVQFNPFHVTHMKRGAIRVYGKRQGRCVWEKPLEKTNGYIYKQTVNENLPKDLPPDDYVVRFGGEDDDGNKYKSESTFSIAKFDWQNNALGKERVIVPPFTPIKVEGGGRDALVASGEKGETTNSQQPTANSQQPTTISFLQTGYRCGGVLWDAVYYKDENLMTGPVTLKVNGEEFKVQDAKFTEVSPDRVVREVTAVQPSTCNLQPASLTLRVTQDYDQDGFCFVTLDFDAPEPFEVNSLQLFIPLRNELAKYFDVLNRAGDVRSKAALDFNLKDGEGEVWNSSIYNQIGRRAEFPADIQPYIWFGGAMKGFCWTMDSVRHLSLRKEVPAERIIRDGKTALLVCDLVNKPVTWQGRKTIEMGMQPTPVKPKAPECGKLATVMYKYAVPTNAIYYAPDFERLSLEPMVNRRPLTFPADDPSFNQWMFRQPKDDPKAFDREIKAFIAKHRDFFDASRVTSANDYYYHHVHDHRYMGMKYPLAYNNPMLITCFWPEWEMYKSEWWPNEWVPENFYNEYLGQMALSRIDFQLYHEKRALDLGAAGIYFDCFFTRGAEGFESPNVFLRPDGTVQPQLTGFLRWRELLKRTAKLCLAEGKLYAGRPIVENHDTLGNAVPMASWLLTGLSTERGHDGGDFQDRFPEAYTLVDIVGAQAGKGTRFIVSANRGDEARQKREVLSLIGYMCAYGIFSIHDQGLGVYSAEFDKAWNLVFDFGWGEPDVEQLCYWDEKEKPVAHSGKDVRMTIAKKKDAMLLMFGNLGEKTEFAITRAPEGMSYTDAMTGEKVDPAHLAIDRHGYRMVVAK